MRLGDFIGGGGEGAVYKIADDPKRVAKVFARNGEDLARAVAAARTRQAKLEAMLRAGPDRLRAHAAWPEFTLYFRGAICGLALPYLRGHHKVSELYNPGSRAKYFPDADWRFLVCVARNCAAATETLHDAGHVMGDVNQSNIMAAADGSVALIDCDSFQVRDPGTGHVYRCTVVTPEFTPPELHGADYDRIDRTPQHDAFGLATLIFHLLFLGRTPFAGRPRGQDLPMVEAIRRGVFPWGRSGRAAGIEPPPGAVMLGDIGPTLADMFERTFAVPVMARPEARDWRVALDDLQKHLVPCSQTPGHHYRRGVSECTWCRLERETGAVLFAGAVPTTAEFDAGERLKSAVDALATAASGGLPRAPTEASPIGSGEPVPTGLRLALERRTPDPPLPPPPQLHELSEYRPEAPQLEPLPGFPREPTPIDVGAEPVLVLEEVPPEPIPEDAIDARIALSMERGLTVYVAAGAFVLLSDVVLWVAQYVALAVASGMLMGAFVAMRIAAGMPLSRWFAGRRLERRRGRWRMEASKVGHRNGMARVRYERAWHEYSVRRAAAEEENRHQRANWLAACAQTELLRVEVEARNAQRILAAQRGEEARRQRWLEDRTRASRANAEEEARYQRETASHRRAVDAVRNRNVVIDNARRALKAEHDRRSADFERVRVGVDLLGTLWSQGLVRLEQSLRSAAATVTRARQAYARLQGDMASALQQSVRAAHAEERRQYLLRQRLAAADIQGIPLAVMRRLEQSGIITAGDVHSGVKVEGLGEKRRSRLLLWRADVERAFKPSARPSADAIRQAQSSIHKQRGALHSEIVRAREGLQRELEAMTALRSELQVAYGALAIARRNLALSAEALGQVPRD